MKKQKKYKLDRFSKKLCEQPSKTILYIHIFVYKHFLVLLHYYP